MFQDEKMKTFYLFENMIWFFFHQWKFKKTWCHLKIKLNKWYKGILILGGSHYLMVDLKERHLSAWKLRKFQIYNRFVAILSKDYDLVTPDPIIVIVGLLPLISLLIRLLMSSLVTLSISFSSSCNLIFLKLRMCLLASSRRSYYLSRDKYINDFRIFFDLWSSIWDIGFVNKINSFTQVSIKSFTFFKYKIAIRIVRTP